MGRRLLPLRRWRAIVVALVAMGIVPCLSAGRATAQGRDARAVPSSGGYWEVGSDGGVFSFGAAAFHGSMGGRTLAAPVVGMAPTPDGGGYWLVASDGGVFAFGDASFLGSMGGHALSAPVIGMAPTPDGRGYWLAASDGGIFAFGDAPFAGSLGGITLVRPVVGMAPTPDGRGYFLVGSDGGVFGFGNAPFAGSLPGRGVSVGNVAGVATTPDGGGYWLVSSDGTAWAFGDAGSVRSLGALGVRARDIAGTAPTDAAGLWLVGSDGGVFGLGDAPYAGSLPALGVAVTDVVGLASLPAGGAPPTSSAQGTGWSPPVTFDRAGVNASSVSCPAPTFCAAVDGAGSVWSWNGAWSGVTTLPNDVLTGVSCATVSFCVAVGSTTAGGVTRTAAVIYDGTSWTPASSFNAVASQGGLRAVSCPTATFCAAVGDQIGTSGSDATLVERYNGSRWSTVTTPNPSAPTSSGFALVAVSCAGTGFCGALGAYQGGRDVFSFIESFDGSTWSIASTPDLQANDALAGVSCPVATSCVAVGTSTSPGSPNPPGGLVDVFNGTTWTVSTNPPSSPMWPVSCPSATECVAGGPGGVVLTDTNGTWAAPLQVDGPNTLTSMSCPSDRLCMATDNTGGAMVRRS